MSICGCCGKTESLHKVEFYNENCPARTFVVITNPRFCKGCGKLHAVPFKQFCSDQCKEKTNRKKKQKALDIAREIRQKEIKEKAKKEIERKKKQEYYLKNRDKWANEYAHNKIMKRFNLTTLTTSI